MSDKAEKPFPDKHLDVLVKFFPSCFRRPDPVVQEGWDPFAAHTGPYRVFIAAGAYPPALWTSLCTGI